MDHALRVCVMQGRRELASQLEHDGYGAVLVDADQLEKAEAQLNEATAQSSIIAGFLDGQIAMHRGELRLRQWRLEESREQYVRYALRVWRDAVEGDGLRNPAAALAVVDVMSLLFDE